MIALGRIDFGGGYRAEGGDQLLLAGWGEDSGSVVAPALR